MAEITVQTGAGSSAVTVSTGARGPAGATGGLTAHKSTHATGGSDELTPADIGAATAAQGTDAREWTAATVDQAEAEAGVATTRRAWTAQRVKQAIAAWFGGPPAVDGAALVSTAAGVRSWTGASITLAPETDPGVSFDSGYISTGTGGFITTGAGSYIYTGVNAPIDANAPITTSAGGYIYTGLSAPIDTGAGGSITTGTGHLYGPNTSGTIALIDPASGTQTFSGAQTFSAQVELTNQAATNATSAMTRRLHGLESLWNMAAVRYSDHAIYGTGGSGATANQVDGDNLLTGLNAGAKAWARRYRIITNNAPSTGGSNAATVPIAIASFGGMNHPGANNAGGAIRCLVGMLETSGGPDGEADALAGRGFGWEIYWSAANARTEIRLVGYGTAFAASAGVAFNVTGVSTLASIIVTHDGAGNLALYGAVGLTRPSLTPIATLAVASLGTGNYANGGYIYWQVANHSTNSTTSQMLVKITDRKLVML